MGVRATAVVALLLASTVVAACGSGGDPAPPQPEPEPAPETRHRLPELGDRWRAHVNAAGGFAIGVPPGWRARDRGTRTLVRAFDRLAAVSIVPDRTASALDLPLEEFARRAFVALPGFDGEPAPGRARPVEHRYDAVEIAGAATAADTGIRQRVRLIVVRRAPHANFTVVVAANADGGRASERIAARMVRTLRSRPVARASP